MAERLNKDKILELAARLMNVTVERGASPNEQAIAMESLRAILDKHDLEMVDVTEAQRKKDFKVGEETFFSEYSSLPGYYQNLLTKIAKAFSVEIVLGKGFHQGKVRQKIYFIGQELDCIIAKYLYQRTADELWRWTAIDARSSGQRVTNTFRANYIFAAADVIGKRLSETREKEKVAQPKLGALIVIKNEMITSYKHERFPNLRPGRAYRITAGEGSNEGKVRGGKLDLNTRGVEGSSKPNGSSTRNIN